ncbi:MAG: hypothetical protein M1830_009018 [Pleopsidium flavum]|nr:MAG: hypothetical protein M1830_009018 [Pleopsidium flavum]
MFSSIAFLSILALVRTAFTASQVINLTALVGPNLSPGAEIFLPSDANYAEDVTQRWTTHKAPSYLGAIKPATEADVQNIVRVASTNEIPFLATGGGHGAAITLGNLKQGIEIDLSNFNSVHLDAERNLLTVGGGTRFAQVIEPLYAAGKEFQIGTAPCVGIIGATLGAGVSSLQGHRGLLIDALISVKLIIAAGKTITASKQENADLFWGIRGAGANFGIVTSATYEVFQATNQGQVLNTNFQYPASANRSIWEILKAYDNTLPSRLAINLAIVYDTTIGELVFVINANFYGPKEEGLSYLRPFFALNPIRSSIEMVPWSEVISTSYFGFDSTACVDGQYVNAYSIGLKCTEVSTFESFFAELSDFSRQHPNIHSNLVIHRFPTQAVLAVPDSETAYPHRQLKMHVQLESNYVRNNTTLDNTVDAFLQSARAKFQRTSGFENLSVYVNFAHGDEGPSVWYGQQKLSQLARLKRRWDPHQVFSWYDAVPLHWP